MPGEASTTSQLIVVFGGRVAFVALSFIATSLVLRTLSAAEAGMFWLCFTAIKIVTGCLADSLDFAVLRSVPKDLKDNRAQALDTLRATFWLRMGIVTALFLAISAFSGPLSKLAFKGMDGAGLLILTGVALMAEMLARSTISFLQASSRFRALVLLDIVVQGSRFGVVVGLSSTGNLTAGTALLAWLAAPLAAFGVGLLLLPPDLLRPAAATKRETLAVFAYARWMILVMAIAAVYERLDVMLLTFFRGPLEVGLYAPASMLAATPELAVAVVLTVLNPKVSQYYAEGRYSELIRAYLRFSIPIGIIGVIGVLTAGGEVIRLLFGAKYERSIGLFQVLAVGTLAFAMVTPVYSALLSLYAPRRVLVITTLGLILMILSGVALIPGQGSSGLALGVTVVRIVMAIVIVVAAQPLLRR